MSTSVEVPLYSNDGHVKELMTCKELEARIEYLERLVKEYEKLKLKNSLLTVRWVEESKNLDKFNKTLCELKLLGEEESREISSCLSNIHTTTKTMESLKEELKKGEKGLEDMTKEITKAKIELDECIFRLEGSIHSTESSIEKFKAERDSKKNTFDAVIENPSTSEAGILSSKAKIIHCGFPCTHMGTFQG